MIFLCFLLTHWGRVTHICVGNLTIIGSDNGLLPGRHQAIIWTNAGILLFGPLGTNFSEIVIKIQTFSFKKMHFKMSFGKWRPSCLGLNVLKNSAQQGFWKNFHTSLEPSYVPDSGMLVNPVDFLQVTVATGTGLATRWTPISRATVRTRWSSKIALLLTLWNDGTLALITLVTWWVKQIWTSLSEWRNKLVRCI